MERELEEKTKKSNLQLIYLLSRSFYLFIHLLIHCSFEDAEFNKINTNTCVALTFEDEFFSNLWLVKFAIKINEDEWKEKDLRRGGEEEN